MARCTVLAGGTSSLQCWHFVRLCPLNEALLNEGLDGSLHGRSGRDELAAEKCGHLTQKDRVSVERIACRLKGWLVSEKNRELVGRIGRRLKE